MIKINNVNSGFESEKLTNPFGFKGNYITELWQTVASVESNNNVGLGLGTQSVLWSDSYVFANEGEKTGNLMMFEITKYALNLIKGSEFKDPYQLINDILEDVYSYAKKITKNKNLKKTFVLNSLVAVDNAVWTLYAKENSIKSFDEIFTGEKQQKMLNIPLITYAVGEEEIRKLLNEGRVLLKIKIGSDPDKDNDLFKMLEWDKNRLLQIHNIAKEYTTEYTTDGKIRYYLDANGRYRDIDMLMEFFDYAEKIGAINQIELFEEPFPEEYHCDVSKMPVKIVADESAHSIEDVKERIQMGYDALALKPIAKTLSMTLLMHEIARENNVKCFCADLTVNPILVEWNKNVGARLEPLSGLKIGAFESNGAQNYVNWNEMLSYHKYGKRSFAEPINGIYHLNEEFYNTNGGIFDISEHYFDLVKVGK